MSGDIILRKVRDKHEITIPLEIRRELGIKIGDQLLFNIKGNNRAEFSKVEGLGECGGDDKQ